MFVQDMSNNLHFCLQDQSISDQQVKWEWIKFKIREMYRIYANKKCKERKDKIAELNDNLNQLEISLANDPNDEILNEIQVIKDELEEFDARLSFNTIAY